MRRLLLAQSVSPPGPLTRRAMHLWYKEALHGNCSQLFMGVTALGRAQPHGHASTADRAVILSV